MKYAVHLSALVLLWVSSGNLVAQTKPAKKQADIKKYVESKMLDDSIYIAKPFKADSLILIYGLKKKPATSETFVVTNIETVNVFLKTPEGTTIAVDFSNPGDEESKLDHYFWPQVTKQKIIEKYGQDAWDNVTTNTLKTGWNKELCKLCWGEPSEIHTTRSPAGVKEQWDYPNGSKLFFNNGKLSSIQAK